MHFIVHKLCLKSVDFFQKYGETHQDVSIEYGIFLLTYISSLILNFFKFASIYSIMQKQLILKNISLQISIQICSIAYHPSYNSFDFLKELEY